MKKNKLKIGLKAKLSGLVAMALVVIGVLATYSVHNINYLTAQIDLLGNQRLLQSDVMADLRASIHAIPRFLWLSLAYPLNSTERAGALAKEQEYLELFKTSIFKYRNADLAPGVRDKFEGLLSHVTPLVEGTTKVVAVIGKNTNQSDAEAKQTILREITPHVVAIAAITREIFSMSAKENFRLVDDATDSAKQASRVTLIFAAILGALFAVISVLFAFRISANISRITESVGSASVQVASASEELSHSSEQLSASSQEQAASVEETSASLTEIVGMVEANVKDAEEANTAAHGIRSISESTRNSMEQLNSAMERILESNARIEKLVKVIGLIGEKTEVIDDIVFKTQLLSFNASVEAERAGEHGRGFAVVAQEVGNLAQMSGKAATEISGIVKDSIREAEEVATENRDRVVAGGQLARDTRAKMDEVINKLKEIVEGTNKIVAASKEQSQGISQISTSLDSFNQSTQETASTAEESASASVELSSQAESLLNMVEQLRLIVTGDTAATGTKSQAPSNGVNDRYQGGREDKKVVPLKFARVEKKVEAKPAKKTHHQPFHAKKASGDTDDSGVSQNGHAHGDGEWEKL
jgi:methyl-accepting chemotaxis protein